MKKVSLLLALALLLTLTACRKKEPETPAPPTPPEPVEEEPLRMEELTVEFPRNGLSTQQLADAVKTLPNLLKTYFDETGLAEVERVTVTVGSSPAATAQALKEGNIDLAFLPAEVFAEEGSETALLADARLLDDGSLRAGTRALICAAPTEASSPAGPPAASRCPGMSWAGPAGACWTARPWAVTAASTCGWRTITRATGCPASPASRCTAAMTICSGLPPTGRSTP